MYFVVPQVEAHHQRLDTVIADLMGDTRVAYAANCRLDACHFHLSANQQIRSFERLSLFEKMASLLLVQHEG